MLSKDDSCRQSGEGKKKQLAKLHAWLQHSQMNRFNATSYTDPTEYKGESKRLQEISSHRLERAWK